MKACLPIWVLLNLFLPSFGMSQEEGAFTRIRFVNAAEVKSVSLEVNDQLLYDDLRPGDKSSGGTFIAGRIRVKATCNESQRSVETQFEGTPGLMFTVLLIGDYLPIVKGAEPQATEEVIKSGVMARLIVLPHALESGETAFRYRVVNGRSNRQIVVTDETQVDRPLLFGAIQTFSGQNRVWSCSISEGDASVEIKLVQDKPFMNATFVAYQRSGNLTFLPLGEEDPTKVIETSEEELSQPRQE